jgi:phosphate transport system permease protein
MLRLAMEAAAVQDRPTFPRTRKLGDRIGDGLLHGLTAIAAFLGVLLVFAIIWRVADGAWPAIKVFHLNFLWDNVWNAPLNEYGARDLIIGTIVTSFGAVLLAAPLSIAIGLFLSELAPPWIRTPVGTLVDMLAAVPSVVIGLWGIYVLAPFNAQHVQPFISSILGWLPIFANGQDKVESTVFSAMIVLTIMIIPITSSICRELFIGVPEELEEGSIGLGATRWEMVKTVVVPSVRGGVVAAIMLGLGRALGEAIAVTQVIGNFIPLQRSIFEPGDTAASRLANQYQGAITNIQISALIYLALILLVITFVTNYAAQRIVKRFEFQRAGG